jgi:ElaB/YqjD/DUF883 family membrane-anchored ribosome-binding protein
MPNNSSSTKAPDLKDVKDKVQEGASTLKDMGKQAVQKAGEKADDATSSAGRGMQSVAETIREHTPDSGYLGAASRAVSDTIDKGGRYLENEGLSGAADDFGALIRNHPVPALCIALSIGFLLGRAMSRS